MLHISNNCYSFQGSAAIVYNVRKTTPIKPSELSGLLYSNTTCLSKIISEDHISTQISLNSPGDFVFIIENIWEFAKENWIYIFGLLVFIGGGKAFSFQIDGIIDIVKKILSAPSDVKLKQYEVASKEMDLIEKRLEIYEKIKAAGVNPSDLEEPLNVLFEKASSLKTEPIVLSTDSSIPKQDLEELQIVDLDDDQE